MTDAFWNNLPASLAALGSFITLLYQMWSKRDAKEGRKEIKADIAKNTEETKLGNTKTDALAAGLGVDTTKPAVLDADATQPIR